MAEIHPLLQIPSYLVVSRYLPSPPHLIKRTSLSISHPALPLGHALSSSSPALPAISLRLRPTLSFLNKIVSLDGLIGDSCMCASVVTESEMARKAYGSFVVWVSFACAFFFYPTDVVHASPLQRYAKSASNICICVTASNIICSLNVTYIRLSCPCVLLELWIATLAPSSVVGE
ncbi:hypothetical protein BJ165DRAFT_416462 [Panaeolus papilionaceus]|nr:hypothetical protein BJ165DRAFT_416462 [Panaeolus papilionaceus]